MALWQETGEDERAPARKREARARGAVLAGLTVVHNLLWCSLGMLLAVVGLMESSYAPAGYVLDEVAAWTEFAAHALLLWVAVQMMRRYRG